jgi:hypothetical protein
MRFYFDQGEEMFKRFLIVLAGVALLSSGVFAQSSVSSDTTQTKKKHSERDVKSKASKTAHKNVKSSTKTAAKKAPSKSTLASKKKNKKSAKSSTIA